MSNNTKNKTLSKEAKEFLKSKISYYDPFESDREAYLTQLHGLEDQKTRIEDEIEDIHLRLRQLDEREALINEIEEFLNETDKLINEAKEFINE